jgi:lysozyme family protein
MLTCWEFCLHKVLASEGGKVDDPQDPGGRTNEGVIQTVYDAWRRAAGLPAQDVYDMANSERDAIYRQQYWTPVSGDALPAGLDYAVFDYAVNSGVARAAMALQSLVGVAADGKIGPLTLAAIAAVPPIELIERLCASRLVFLRRLSTWPRFGTGWTNRVKAVQSDALKLANPA